MGPDPLNVGNLNGGGFDAAHQFNGYLDGMRIHNTAVDQAYVNARFAEVPISISPTSVNRIIGGSFNNTHFSDLFSTHTSSTQHTLLQLSTATLQAALAARLGPLGPGEMYQIDSATLLVGSPTDAYSVPSTAHEVLTAYNPATVTYASFNNGGVAGLNFDAIAEATGLVAGPMTSFDLTDIVQRWVDGEPNLGLYFPMLSGVDMETAAANVLFEIHATRVATPEPSTLALWSILGLAGSVAIVLRGRGRRWHRIG